jgi:hypothetical protein
VKVTDNTITMADTPFPIGVDLYSASGAVVTGNAISGATYGISQSGTFAVALTHADNTYTGVDVNLGFYDDNASSSGFEVSGTDGGDEFLGGAGPDSFTGTGGADVLDGGGGSDTLNGGPGADTLIGGDGDDTVTYADTAPFGQFGVGVRADLTNAASNSSEAQGDVYSSVENVIGSAFSDTIFGNGVNNRLYGGSGGDDLFGMGGDDQLFGQAGDDEIYGNDGDDTLDGGEGNDTLEGGAGADVIRAGEGDDLLLYAEARASWTFTRGDGVVVATAGATTETLSGVESVRFSDGVFSMANLLNRAPTVTAGIADITTAEDAVFTFTAPAGTFTDPDAGEGDTLTYSARLEGGGALPAWLTFNAATRTFSGTPANGNVGAITVVLTATDRFNVSASDSFVLTVSNTNDAPELVSPLPDHSVTSGSSFNVAVGNGRFLDVDAGDTLTYSAALASGGALPSWISFNAATRTFTGVASGAEPVDILVTVTDRAGASASDVFRLNVQPAPNPPPPPPPPIVGELRSGHAGGHRGR